MATLSQQSNSYRRFIPIEENDVVVLPNARHLQYCARTGRWKTLSVLKSRLLPKWVYCPTRRFVKTDDLLYTRRDRNFWHCPNGEDVHRFLVPTTNSV